MSQLAVFLFPVFLFVCGEALTTAQDINGLETDARFVGSLGAILDLSSPDGRQHKLAMEVAVEDYQNSTANELSLHVEDSQGNPNLAASGARRLINDKRVQSILGLQTWVETAVVADVGDKARVPILSFAAVTPSWASERWPFLLRSRRGEATQMKAIAAIVSSWQWRRVTVIYEDSDYMAGSTIIPDLIEAIRAAGSDVDYQLAISPFASVSEELEELISRQCRIFVVHTTAPLAARLFEEALRMGMMEMDYVWITTDMTSDFFDSVNSSVINSMQGVLGVKTNYPSSIAFNGFSRRLQRRFRLEYPEEAPPRVDILGVQAYDTVWTVAKAMERVQPKGNYSLYFHTDRNTSGDAEPPNSVFREGNQLLGSILATNFSGLSGKVQFLRGVLLPSQNFQVVNVVGKSYREMGYWTSDLGFSKSLLPGSKYSTSMETLGQVIWPGGSSMAPREWAPPTGGKPLRIGVPAISAFPDYVSAKNDSSKNSPVISGFSIDIFRAAVQYLPYRLPFDLIAYYGTYDSLVEHLPSKTFDAVVGDTAILSYRCKLAQFSQPYTQSGYVMVVPLKPEYSSKAWIFTKPFTSSLWVSIGALCFINSLVIWLLERSSHNGENPELGVSIWLAFAALFNSGERVQNNLSRVVMVIWLFVGLVLTSNYTATLSSMLTVQRLQPSVTDIEQLKRTHAVVGCNKGGSIVRFLHDFLGFPMTNIKQIPTMDEYPPAFRKGEIQAAILAMGHAKMFLAKYCREFTAAGPTYHAGGFGFIFPKGSPLLPDVSEAILKVFESGKMQEMENGVVSSYNCSNSPASASDGDRLGPGSFWGLFAVMGATSGVVLLLFAYSKAERARGAAAAAVLAWARRLREALQGLHGARVAPTAAPDQRADSRTDGIELGGIAEHQTPGE